MRHLRIPLTLLALAAVFAWPAAVPAQQAPADANQQSRIRDRTLQAIADLLQKSGYKYSNPRRIVWTVPFEGKSLGEYPVVLTAKGDLAIAFVVVAKKAQIRLDPEMARAALELNYRLERAKVGLDEDGDLFVLADMPSQLLTVAEFRKTVEAVATAADAAHATLKPWLAK